MFFCINIESIRKPQLSWCFQSIASSYPQFPQVSHLPTMENSLRPPFPHLTALVCISSFILNRIARQNKEIQYSRDDSSDQESFCHQKNNKKSDCLCMKFSSTLIQLWRGALILYFRITTLFSDALSFSKNISAPTSKLTKWPIKRVDYHLSSSRLTSKIHPVLFLLSP